MRSPNVIGGRIRPFVFLDKDWGFKTSRSDELLCFLRRTSDIEDDPSVNLALLEAIENMVDRPQRLLLDRCLDLPFGGELQRFLEVLPSAHNRAAQGLTVQHEIE